MIQSSASMPVQPNPLRDKVQVRNESFTGVGGVEIFARSWHPQETPRGVLVISHGFKSHSGYYDWAAEQFAASGLAVYALDHRGRGKSGGERFFVEKLSDYVDDLGAFITQTKARQSGLPVFLLGHSAGGVISCVYALDHQAELAGLICESFAFRVYAPDFVLGLVKGISHLTPHAHVLKLPNEGFSRLPEVVEAMNADPLLAGEVQPTLTVAEMVRGDERLEKEFGTLTLPLFICHGTKDVVTRPEGSQFFYDNAGSSDKTLKLYEGHYHDLLNDLDREKVLADMQGWIDGRLPKA